MAHLPGRTIAKLLHKSLLPKCQVLTIRGLLERAASNLNYFFMVVKQSRILYHTRSDHFRQVCYISYDLGLVFEGRERLFCALHQRKREYESSFRLNLCLRQTLADFLF